MHPIAVVELLWRSCCAPDVEKLAGGLGTRLKVRQWTQLLVDQSLLLGSSSEGIHLHDIVLTSLRKRLSAEEPAQARPGCCEPRLATAGAVRRIPGGMTVAWPSSRPLPGRPHRRRAAKRSSEHSPSQTSQSLSGGRETRGCAAATPPKSVSLRSIVVWLTQHLGRPWAPQVHQTCLI